MGERLISSVPRGPTLSYPLPGGKSHTIPGITDCKACHQGGRSEVLGFSTLQLSPDRDPGALHADGGPDAIDLRSLVDRGLLIGLPQHLLDQPPRIASASRTNGRRSVTCTAIVAIATTTRGRCGTSVCTCARRALGGSQATETTVNHPVRKPAPGQSPDSVNRIEPGSPERSGLVQRARSRSPALQMPPLGPSSSTVKQSSCLRTGSRADARKPT
jgi:hypothetical protein